MADLKTNLLGFVMNSPVIGASGTVGYGVEYEELADFFQDRRHLRQGPDPARPVRQQGRAPVGDPLRPHQQHRPAEPRRSAFH